MRPAPRPSPVQLAARAQRQDLRKAANELAHQIRLGKVPSAVEDTYGPCMVTRDGKRCAMHGRRFRFTRWDPRGDAGLRAAGIPMAMGDVVSSPEMCVVHAMAVIEGMAKRRRARG